MSNVDPLKDIFKRNCAVIVPSAVNSGLMLMGVKYMSKTHTNLQFGHKEVLVLTDDIK